jgi:hypothetical protein
MLPTIRDISPTNCADLDERAAVSRFYQLDIPNAETLIAQNPLVVIDDLVHMGPVGLSFYFEAFRRVLLSSKLDGTGILDSLPLLVKVMRRQSLPEHTFVDLISCIDYILDHEGAFSDGGRVDSKAISRLRLEIDSLRALIEMNQRPEQ